MANELTPLPSAPLGTDRFANPLKQAMGILSQPAVKRSLPLIFLMGVILAGALAWATLRTPPQKVLFAGLGDADKAAVTQALKAANIDSDIDDSGSVTVGEDDFHRARMLLAQQDLPKAAPGGYALLDQLPMGVSRAVEGERLRQARETELARSIQEIDAVAEARVHLATPETSVFVRDQSAPSASVVVKLQQGRALSDAQVRSIVNLVASSVPGMKPDAVTVVDQMGMMLSKSAGGVDGAAESDARIDLQRRVEEKVRQQVTQLLTPMLGAGNFTTEVQADVDLNETQATRESYEKQGAVRAEQGNWTGDQPGNGAQAPGGIPGALSNTAPPAASLTTPAGAQVNPQPAAQTPAGPVTQAMKQSDSYARSYDLGKEVSVSRTAPGGIKRLSVAVLLRDPDKGRRTALEIQQVTDLVRAAVGYDAARNDLVTVVSKKFNAPLDTPVAAPWYQGDWVPMVVRNLTAIVIALLVLLLGVRPLAAALMKKRDEAPARGGGGLPIGQRIAGNGQPMQMMMGANGQPTPVMMGANGQPVPVAMGANGQPMAQQPGVSLSMLDDAASYEERVGLVRGFTRENPARAALAVRDMIKGEARG